MDELIFNDVPDLLVGDITANASGGKLIGIEYGDATVIIDIDEARALHEWLGRALPVSASPNVSTGE